MANIKVAPQYRVAKKTITTFKNIQLDGVETLKAEKTLVTLELKYQLNPKTNNPAKIVSKKQIKTVTESVSYQLAQVAPEDLIKYRRCGVPGFVLKMCGILYYACIDKDMSFLGSQIIEPHFCARNCRRLSAAEDEFGGCEKVRSKSWGIERYPWITNGYESFNTRHDCFVVAECLHYEKCMPRKVRPVHETIKDKKALEDFMWA